MEKHTTDTGYTNEKIITKYANVIFRIIVILGIIGWIIMIVTLVNNASGAGIAIGVLLGSGALVIYILLADVWRAFIRTFANISINLHELNMKTQ